MISVLMLAYNHEDYISQAIESVLNQEINVPLELIIGEDFSTDNTLAICQEYAMRYPDKVVLISRDCNVGLGENFVDIFNRARGEYVALCEGDDYWTNPSKLQEQYWLMERKKDVGISFHNVEVLNTIKEKTYAYPRPTKEFLSFKDILFRHYIPTCSVMMRRSALPVRLPESFKNFRFLDIPLELFAVRKHRAYFWDVNYAAYRKHLGGISESPTQKVNGRRAYIDVYNSLWRHFPIKKRMLLLLMLAKHLLLYKLKK